MMSARWQLLCGILVLGLWLAAASSKECPYRRTGYVPKPLYPGAANIQSDCYNTNPDHGYKSPSKKYSGVPQRSYCPKVGGLESHCQPAKDCAVWYDLVRKTPGTACTLNNGYEKGLCCPGLPSNSKLNLCCLNYCIIKSYSFIINSQLMAELRLRKSIPVKASSWTIMFADGIWTR